MIWKSTLRYIALLLFVSVVGCEGQKPLTAAAICHKTDD